jgi:hypothetical protein
LSEALILTRKKNRWMMDAVEIGGDERVSAGIKGNNLDLKW